MNILCITGTRADYGIYRPLLLELERDPVITLKLVATGMHVLNEYGLTLDQIHKDGLSVAGTPSILVKGDSTYAMSQSVGLGIIYFSDILQYNKPDFVLLLGDRGEMLAAAIAAHYQNIGIIHLHGGECSGSADDTVRHAISTFAHLHFVSNTEAQHILVNRGEAHWRVFPVGSLRKTEVQRVYDLPNAERERLMTRYELATALPKVLVAMHPDSKDPVSFDAQIEPVLQALRSMTQTQFIVIGPNSDAGGEVFKERLYSFVQESSLRRYYASVPSSDYLFLLSQADLLVGNSSSGIIEAPFFQLPFVNIGARQKNRTHAANVIHAEYEETNIKEAVSALLDANRKTIVENPYDLCDCPEQEIVHALKQLSEHPQLLNKR